MTTLVNKRIIITVFDNEPGVENVDWASDSWSEYWCQEFSNAKIIEILRDALEKKEF